MKTSAILRKAGDVLRERGWCQGKYKSESGGHCGIGSILAVANGNDIRSADLIAHLVADDYLSAADICGSMLRWNDRPGRTAKEVQIAMDATYVLALQIEGDEPDDFEVL